MSKPAEQFEHRLPYYPFGVQCYRAPTPLPEEWQEDLAKLSGWGMTHIQLRPQWRWHERVQGRFVWDDLDQLFDVAQRQLSFTFTEPRRRSMT